MPEPIEITGRIVGFATADIEAGGRVMLAKAVMAEEVGGGEIVLKWYLNTPSSLREAAAFFNEFANDLEVRGDDELNRMLNDAG